MTTIVWDGYDLAAERLVVDEDKMVGYMKKIIKLDNGGYVAGAGYAFASQAVADWLNGQRDMPLDTLMKHSDVIHIDPSGRVTKYDSTCIFAEPAFDIEVMGSGGKLALAVLYHGGTAKEAVQIACRIDPYSGGKVDVVNIHPRPEKKEKNGEPKNPVS